MESFSMTILYIEKNQLGTYYYKDPEKTIFHRLDGPAIEWTNGDKEWWQNGKCHRGDGPAVESANGYKEYWYQGEEFLVIKTNEQWKKHLKWLKFR